MLSIFQYSECFTGRKNAFWWECSVIRDALRDACFYETLERGEREEIPPLRSQSYPTNVLTHQSLECWTLSIDYKHCFRVSKRKIRNNSKNKFPAMKYFYKATSDPSNMKLHNTQSHRLWADRWGTKELHCCNLSYSNPFFLENIFFSVCSKEFLILRTCFYQLPFHTRAKVSGLLWSLCTWYKTITCSLCLLLY